MKPPIIKKITSHSNELIKNIKALQLKKNRAASKLFYAEGLQQLGMALDCNWQPQTLLITAKGLAHKITQQTLHAWPQTQAAQVTDEIMEKISARDNAAPVLAVYAQQQASLAKLPVANKAVFVALENVRDPGNLGTIIRTADAAGVAGVILLGQCCDPWAVETVRASMGSIFAMPISTTTTQAFTSWAAANKIQLIGTALQDAVAYQTITYRTPRAVVMGSEQTGLSAELRAACDALVKLPMHGKAESLNLAVATGIMLYHAHS